MQDAFGCPVTTPQRRTARARGSLLAVQLTVWWPMYLAFNTWGRAYPLWASHLNPCAPIFAGCWEHVGGAWWPPSA